MGFWSSVGSALGNFGSSLSLHDATFGWSDYSARQSATKDSLRKSMNASKEMSRWEALNMPSYTVTGLRDAGLNPILAVGDVSSPMQLSAQHPTSQGNSQPLQGLAKKESQIADATLDNIKARTTAERVSADALKSNAETNKQNALTNQSNAVTNQWQMFDAKSIGAAGFNVQFLGKGLGGNGDFKVIHTLRVNKVTGEAYDALSGQRVRVIGELPANSAKQASENATHNYYQYNNYYDKLKDSGRYYNLPR